MSNRSRHQRATRLRRSADDFSVLPTVIVHEASNGSWYLGLGEVTSSCEGCEEFGSHLNFLVDLTERLDHPSFDGQLRSLPDPASWRPLACSHRPAHRGWSHPFVCGCVLSLIALES